MLASGMTARLSSPACFPFSHLSKNVSRHPINQAPLRSLKEGPGRDELLKFEPLAKTNQRRPGRENGTGLSPEGSPAKSSDLPWNELDKDEKSNWLKRAFANNKARTVFSTSETQAENFTSLFEEQDTRQRFFKRCLIPTGTAMVLGCVAYVMQELGFSDLSVLGHNLVAGLLGFLMAFITSTNYNRWLQARAGLCNITIMCVDIASRADVFLTTKDADGIRARREMARYLRLLYTSIILTLTDTSLWGSNTQEGTVTSAETSKQLRRILMEDASPSERRLLLGGGPRDLPFLVIDLIRNHVNRDSTLKSFVHTTFGSQFIAINCQDSLRGKVDELFPAIGAVLSLALTPLPMGYRTIFSTLLRVLVYTFPFALVSEITWETPIVSGFLAFGYYGVYSMSQELMLPFRPRAVLDPSAKNYKTPGLFSCNAEWVRVMNEEFNHILVARPS